MSNATDNSAEIIQNSLVENGPKFFSSTDCNGTNCHLVDYFDYHYMHDNCSINATDIGGNWTDVYCGQSFPEDLGVLVVENPDEFKYPWISNQHFYPNILTYLVTMIFGLVGNTAFIAVMAGDRKARTTTNVFLVSLTVADLLMLAICAPLEIVRLFVVLLNFGGAACRMGHYFMMLSFTASVLNLTAVSLERFIVIVYPMRARSVCTMSNCRRSVMLVWAASLLLACPIIWVMGEESIIYTNQERTVKVVAHYCRDVDTIIFHIYRLLVLFCIPGILMIAFYTAVIRELWLSTKNISALTSTGRSLSDQSCLMKSSESYHMNQSISGNSFHHISLDDHRTRVNLKSKPDLSPNASGKHSPVSYHSVDRVYSISIKDDSEIHMAHPQPSRGNVRFQVPLLQASKKKPRAKGDEVKRTRKQVIKMLIVIVLLFVLCWGPTIVTEMLIGLGQQTFTQEFYVFKWVSSLLPFVHCCINPVIYCFMSKNFRASMSKALSYPCRYCRRKCYGKGRPQRSTSREYYAGSVRSKRGSPTFNIDLATIQTDLDVTKM